MSKITVLKSTRTKADKGYPIVELAYKTEDGKTKGMKIFGFGAQKDNSEVAGNAKVGDVLEAQFQQNAKGFWEFGSLRSTGETAALSSTSVSAASVPASGGKGNWETSEERAARQVYIVRQSSVSSAIALKPKASVSEVIEVAREFEAFVMGKDKPQPTGEIS